MAVFNANNAVCLNVGRILAVLLLFIGLLTVTQRSEHGQRLKTAISGAAKALPKPWASSQASSAASTEPSFYEVGTLHQTDKVTSHSYQDMYEKYLPAVRHKKIKMLEIGLGCDMLYGPGHSYHTWLDYFTDIDLYFMEYDAACAEKWAGSTEGATIFAGDQGDPATLERFISEYGGDFDIIIDDGGHTMKQQMTSIQHLWKAVKPGGLYFCEDLETSWVPEYGAKPGETTMMQYIHAMVDDLTQAKRTGQRVVDFPDVETVVHIDCSKEVCAFQKRGDVDQELYY